MLFLLSFILLLPFTQIHANEKATLIDSLLSTYHRYRLFQGTVLVAENGQVIYKRGFGQAVINENIANAPDTRFRIASLTKAFTAMLIMQLVEEEKMELDDCISDFLEDYPGNKGDLINMHHLLSHTSGIPDYVNFPVFWKEYNTRLNSPDELITLFADSTLEFVPGAGSRYSNSNYVLLGKIIEQVSGKSFASLLKEKILGPLGMTNSGFNNSDSNLHNEAQGYNRGLFAFTASPYQHMSGLYAAAGMYATAEDLFIWDQALYSETLLSAKFRDYLFTPDWNGYGYGWQALDIVIGSSIDTFEVTMHNGGISGFRSRIIRIPESRHTIILLQNCSMETLNQISDKILAILFDEPVEFPRKSAAEIIALRMNTSGVEKGLLLYEQLKKENPDTVFFSEMAFNSVGYQLMALNLLEEAIAILELNVAAYPSSANTYDSLGEAYMKNGDYIHAKRNYQMVFEKLPGDINISPQFKRILIESAQSKLAQLKKLSN
jgi:CubicO group peptidase (beta-lactamase class C family)